MTAFYILAALSVGVCAGFLLGGVLSSGKISDLEAEAQNYLSLWMSVLEDKAVLQRHIAEQDESLAALRKFDHDGDGKPGGSRKKAVQP